MTKKTVGVAVAAIFGLGILFVSFMDGAQSTSVAEAAEKKKSAHGGAKAAPAGEAPSADGDKVVTFDASKLPAVVATINKTEISRNLFARIMGNVLGEMGKRGEPLTAEKLKVTQSKVLESLINSEVLYKEAVAEKIKVDEKQVDEQFAGIKSHFPSEDEFNKTMVEQKVTPAEVKEDIRKNFIIRTLVEDKILKAVKVSEAEAQKYYNANKDNFKRPEMVHARHIVVRMEINADEKHKAEATKKIEEVQAKLKAGEKFEELAKQYSEDGAKANGGDLGFFPKGAMVKEFEDAVWGMKPGEISKVVPTQFGLHLIKMEERKPDGIAPFSEVKDDVVRGLESEVKREKIVKYIADLKAKSKIKINL